MNLTHKLGNLRETEIDQKIKVSGWVNTKRNLGELIFIDLRDATGISQVIINKENPNYELINGVKNEYVLAVEGVVKKRTNINEKIPTGMIEIHAQNVEIINKSASLPLQIVEDIEASEDTRLDYRYLDIRRPNIYKNLKLRHEITTSIRNYLNNHGFLDIETPILTKSTPEGARDYLVPSRVNKNSAYALPQSPQIYKNLLMIGGIDKYYQIAKCFRDEDLRADRQPEFTQVDMEMAFMSQDEIMENTENLIKQVVKDVKGIDLNDKFLIMSYDQAMEEYGIDKPDIRFDLKLKDVTTIFDNSAFKVFKEAPLVKAINVKKQASNYSRKNIEQLEKIALDNGAKGLAWLKYDTDFSGPIAKFFNEEEKIKLKEKLLIEENDLILFVADKKEIVNQALSAVRNYLGKELELYDAKELAFLWVVDWPMFEYDEELDRLFAMHHPFTMPQNEKFEQDDLLKTRAQAYDIVLNGYELGGGSIRINNNKLQKEMFQALSFQEEEIQEEFGFLIEAYKYGAPYHGGIALGLDRLVMLLAGEKSIRDVIAFPKNARAKETMINSPGEIANEQMEELNIIWKNDKNN